VERWDVDWGVK
jgi:hypothetical protein